jgi:hypothetical protein
MDTGTTAIPPLTATAVATARHPTARVRLVSLKTDGDLMDVAALIAENHGRASGWPASR